MKLSPNFSWQKYEQDNKLTDEEQFMYQLQRQWIEIANALNGTINDDSFWLRERLTGFTWTDSRPIYTQTFTGTITPAPGDTVVNHGITGMRTLISAKGTFQNAVPLTTFGLPIPHVDPVTAADGVGLTVTPTTFIIRTASATWLNYIYNVTLEYTKG